MSGRDVSVVLCTTPAGDSKRLATELIERRLAACVNIIEGVQSVYRWEGKVTTDMESLLVIKTIKEALPQLRKDLVAIHPYDVPEIIALHVDDGSVPYLDWVAESVHGRAE
jgi:periplasmic divalent cation tolerance protein